MKILTTGNPSYGLAAGISAAFDSDFISRSNGYDISTDEGMDRVVELSLQYDVFVNNIYTEKMNNYSQVRLLDKMYRGWLEANHNGHMICIGSISDHINTEQPWIKYVSYGAEKLALQRLCETINHNRENISPHINCTYISLGHMHTPLVDRYHPDEVKLDVEQVANVIDWIIKCPECVESITLTKRK